MHGISQLGYLEFTVSDLAAWETLMVDVMGTDVARRWDSGAFTTRWDGHAERLFVEPGDADDVTTVGLQVDDDQDLEALVARLKSAGNEVVEGTDAERAHRRVTRLVHFTEPGGVHMEAYYGPTMADTAFDSSIVRTNFKADDLGLGHVVLRANNLQETLDFFTDVVGLKLSDRIICEIMGYPVDIAFTHTNGRHHTIAFGEKLPKHVAHFMLETNSLDDVGMGFDRCLKHGVEIHQTIGRHPNDRMVSFYACTPSGFHFEYGWGAVEVDESHDSTKVYDQVSEWGHHHPSQLRPRKKKA